MLNLEIILKMLIYGSTNFDLIVFWGLFQYRINRFSDLIFKFDHKIKIIDPNIKKKGSGYYNKGS
jgi:hypothetical protein